MVRAGEQNRRHCERNDHDGRVDRNTHERCPLRPTSTVSCDGIRINKSRKGGAAIPRPMGLRSVMKQIPSLPEGNTNAVVYDDRRDTIVVVM